MKAIVVYESMYGNTHVVAEAIAEGLSPLGQVDVVSVEDATAELVGTADLLVVGGPTHAHGMSRPATRASAIEAAADDPDLDLDDDAEGQGLREWFDSLAPFDDRAPLAAAYDTRVKGPSVFTGRASKGIDKRLRHLGCTMVAEPRSFLVDTHNHLLGNEEAQARAHGQRLAAAVATTVQRST
ncbi:MAG: flavodoxin family protein [Acidimicrobiales bacterium]